MKHIFVWENKGRFRVDVDKMASQSSGSEVRTPNQSYHSLQATLGNYNRRKAHTQKQKSRRIKTISINHVSFSTFAKIIKFKVLRSKINMECLIQKWFH